MYSCGPPHMDAQKQDDQHELTYSNYVRTQDVTLKTCRRRWMIGRSGERGSGISVLAARHDDDDDDIPHTYLEYTTHYTSRIHTYIQPEHTTYHTPIHTPHARTHTSHTNTHTLCTHLIHTYTHTETTFTHTDKHTPRTSIDTHLA